MSVIELAGRVAYYQSEGPNTFFLVDGFTNIRMKVLKKIAESKIQSGPSFIRGKNIRPLFHKEKLLSTELGTLLYESYQAGYMLYFSKLVREIGESNTTLIMLYPMPPREGGDSERLFFSKLCSDFGIQFIDAGAALAKYPTEAVTLEPTNAHLSRFGNYIVASQILQNLPSMNHRATIVKHDTRSTIFGDLAPNSDRILIYNRNLPFQEITNSHGLRMIRDLDFPSTRQRVLLLGDSFTYGAHLNNQDTYPAILQHLDKTREYLNAGVSGYSIVEEYELWSEKAKFTQPDIVILQAHDNDIISGMTTYKKNLVLRNKNVYQYSAIEKQFITDNIKH